MAQGKVRFKLVQGCAGAHWSQEQERLSKCLQEEELSVVVRTMAESDKETRENAGCLKEDGKIWTDTVK